jgi:signal transduction histidine kinase
VNGEHRSGGIRGGITSTDVGIAVGFAVLSQIEAWGLHSLEGPRLLLAIAGFVTTLALVLRRRAPLLTAAITVAYFIFAFLAGHHQNPDTAFPGATMLLAFPDISVFPGACVLLASYSVAAHSEPRRALMGGLLILAFLAGVAIAAGVPPEEPLIVIALNAGAWALGRQARRRRMRTTALASQVVTLEHEQDERTAAAAAEERERIARELHDAVAHSVSVMVVQAAAERRTVPAEMKSTRDALEAIEQAGRQALDELRRLLGMLRTEDEGAELAPQPGMRQIGDLVEHVREAGLPVELGIKGKPVPLPPGVDLSAYRIVQEALTNALKHAGPATAQVSVNYLASQLELEIIDDGQGPGDGGGSGQGLVGMRQRVELFGGALATGKGENGGYAVRASFPLERTP